MRMRVACWGIALALLPLLRAATPPAAWVPMRWTWSDPATLDLLSGTPVNCLLLPDYPPELVRAASARGLTALAVVAAGADAVAEAGKAAAAKLDGIVLEGDFAPGTAATVKAAFPRGTVVELPSRNRLQLGTEAPVIGSFQGLWPGVQVQEDGAAKAGPSGAAWIDTNTGFLRAARAWGDTPVWIANRPPAHTVIPGERYQQAIADAAIAGARWVVALDGGFAARLVRRDATAVRDWQRMAQLLGYFERHPEWRAMRPYGKLAIVQDPAKGGLLSGGILDMIAARHTPARPIPRQRLSTEALQGATMAVNVDAGSLTDEQRTILRDFTRSGGTLLTGPAGWTDQGARAGSITLDKDELARLNEIWRDVNTMVGRRNLGVRLFNVSSMLSNLLVSRDGKQVIVHLVNYSGYPVENIAVHFLGKFGKATLLTPEGAEKALEVYTAEEGGGVDIDRVGMCATVRLE
jgi:hypothetical protein